MPKIVQNPADRMEEPRFSISGGHPFSYGSGFAVSGSHYHSAVRLVPHFGIACVDEVRGSQVVPPMPPPVKMDAADVAPVQEPADLSFAEVQAIVTRAQEIEKTQPTPPVNNADFEDFVNTAKRAGF